MKIPIPKNSFLAKFERNHKIVIAAKIGTVYPPGILNPLGSAADFSDRLNLIVASDTPKYISNTER